MPGHNTDVTTASKCELRGGLNRGLALGCRGFKNEDTALALSESHVQPRQENGK